MTPHVLMESALWEPGRSLRRFYRLMHAQGSSLCPSAVSAPRCCCKADVGCWWGGTAALTLFDTTQPLGHNLRHLDQKQPPFFLIPPLPGLCQPWVSPRKPGQELGRAPAQSFCRRCQCRAPGAPQKNGKKGGRRDRGDTRQEWTWCQTQRKGGRERGRKGISSLKEEKAGWKHSKDKEHSCRESWGLSSGLGTDLSCSLWKVMSRSCLQCVLRSLECELSCLLLDSLFTKLGGPVLIFYSNSFCSVCGWTC